MTMIMTSPKTLNGVLMVSRSRSSIVITVGVLAAFLVVGSILLSLCPINSSFQGYFHERYQSKKPALVSSDVASSRERLRNWQQDLVIKEPTSGFEEERGSVSGTDLSSDIKKEVGMNDGAVSDRKKEVGMTDGSVSDRKTEVEMTHDSVSQNSSEIVEIDRNLSSGFKNNSEKNSETHDDEISQVVVPEVERGSASSTKLSSDLKKEVGLTDGSVSQNDTAVVGMNKNLSSGFKNDSGKVSSEIHDDVTVRSDAKVKLLPSESTANSGTAVSRSCDLYQGKWVYDPAGPLYTNNTCPFITQMQNCQGNGRPDKDYENYKWKPDQCDLQRFNPRKFLELMRGKTLAYVGDSVARNQMESMLCILWQEEAPRNRGNRRMQRWYFKSTSTMIVRIWSSWLVHQNGEPFKFAPKGITKVFLDAPDETFMEFVPTFDVVVLSSGHWFAKQSAYILNNDVVGGQLWWPKDAGKMKINNVEAFGISVETSMTAIANHPKFTGLAVVRTYSPDHYEGGAWNTGGSCTGKVKPTSELVRNGFTDVMHEKQIAGFQRAVEKAGNASSKLRLMDITEVFAYRPDGHPGPYRSLDPNKITKRGPNGKPPSQDCLHWCMPGPIDTWNEILFEIIRREFEGA